MSKYIIYTAGPHQIISPREMPVGTKYRQFDMNRDLKEGVIVYASLFAGKRIGKITKIPKDQKVLCEIDGKSTFISDIQYTIV